MRKILSIFMLMVLVIPFHVKAEEITNDDSAKGYVSSIRNDIYYFEFGDGYKLSFPFEVRIKSIFFNFLDIVDTDIPKEKITIEYNFDIETIRSGFESLNIIYKDAIITHNVYVEIPEYIYIDENIIVHDYEFDIWNYLKTNVSNKGKIEIIGEYDLNTNGKYALLIKYNDTIEQTIIVVDIENNKEIIETICPEVEKEVLTYETKNYISNYYTYNTESNDTKECTCNIPEIPTPINKIIYSDNDKDYELFEYISYVFYGLVIILLSIFVVRKK